MSHGRTLPLCDPSVQPPTWNERMVLGEFAVLASFQKDVASSSTCVVFPAFAEAEAYARQQVAEHPQMRCRVYDSNGLGKSPALEVCGAEFKEKGEMSRHTRRLLCAVLLILGSVLFTFDWVNDFRYMWPSTIGARMVPTGLLLLAFEVGIELNAAQRKRKSVAG